MKHKNPDHRKGRGLRLLSISNDPGDKLGFIRFQGWQIVRDFFNYLRRNVVYFALVMALGGGVIFWFQQWREPFRESEKMSNLIRSLESRRPTEVTPGKWECAVGWTCTLHANSLDAYQSDVTSMRQFREELSSKLDGPVSMETIHWIWDSYAILCRGGANYQRRFRPQMMEAIDRTP